MINSVKANIKDGGLKMNWPVHANSLQKAKKGVILISK